MKSYKEFLGEGNSIRDGYITDNESTVTWSPIDGLLYLLNNPRGMPESVGTGTVIKLSSKALGYNVDYDGELEDLLTGRAFTVGKDLEKLERKFKSDVGKLIQSEDKKLAKDISKLAKGYGT